MEGKRKERKQLDAAAAPLHSHFLSLLHIIVVSAWYLFVVIVFGV